MKIYCGSDHNGIEKMYQIESYFNKQIDVIISSVPNNPADDYPDFAKDVCKNVAGTSNIGILMCGNGIGMSIAANKVKGIRCARVLSVSDAKAAKEHNGANVIALSAAQDIKDLIQIVETFLLSNEPSEERHLRRIDKINKMESSE